MRSREASIDRHTHAVDVARPLAASPAPVAGLPGSGNLLMNLAEAVANEFDWR
jgi:hypothetical protein